MIHVLAFLSTMFAGVVYILYWIRMMEHWGMPDSVFMWFYWFIGVAVFAGFANAISKEV